MVAVDERPGSAVAGNGHGSRDRQDAVTQQDCVGSRIGEICAAAYRQTIAKRDRARVGIAVRKRNRLAQAGQAIEWINHIAGRRDDQTRRFDDRAEIVFDFAVRQQTGGTRRRHARRGESIAIHNRAQREVSRNRKRNDIVSSRDRKVRQKLLARVTPVTITIQVRPRVDET